jgi:hypothetical protein
VYDTLSMYRRRLPTLVPRIWAWDLDAETARITCLALRMAIPYSRSRVLVRERRP